MISVTNFHGLANNRVNLPDRPVTLLAKRASAAPGPPAGHAQRWASQP